MDDLRTAAQAALDAYSSPKHMEFADAMEALRAALAEQPEPTQECSDEDVICPNCCSTFRAIPVAVQRLMLDAGFGPPFTAPPKQPEPWRCGCGANLYIDAEGRPASKAPPRKPVRLTDAEITDIFESKARWHYPPIGATDREFARDIEAAVLKANGVEVPR